jgi:hypothetical protein
MTFGHAISCFHDTMFENGLRAQNKDIVLTLVMNIFEKTYVITQRERNIVFILTAYSFCISTPILTLEMTLFITIVNKKKQFGIPSNGPKVYMKLRVSIIGQCTPSAHAGSTIHALIFFKPTQMYQQTNTR